MLTSYTFTVCMLLLFTNADEVRGLQEILKIEIASGLTNDLLREEDYLQACIISFEILLGSSLY